MHPLLRATLAAALIGAPLAAAAEDMGRITAYVDGAKKTWHTITVDRRGGVLSTATVVQGPRLTELHVQGHPQPRFTTEDVFSLDVRYIGPYAPGMPPLSVDIMLMPEGMGGPFWTSRGARQQPRIDIVAFEIWGNVGRLEAVFDGQLCLRPIISSATDPDTCRTVTGVVETRLFAE